MEPYLVVLLGAALTSILGLIGWVANKCVQLSQAVASVQSWQGSMTEEHNYLRNRVDELVRTR